MSIIKQKKVLSSFKDLISWSGDDPNRSELLKTPQRAMKTYQEIFSGYQIDLSNLKAIESNEIEQDFIFLRNHDFFSICEHHILPFTGKISICYIPDKKLLGIGNIRDIIDCFSKRLQIQERITFQIAEFLEQLLMPKGIAVLVEASHLCGSLTKHCSSESNLVTTCFLGKFKDINLQQSFLNYLK